MKFGLFGALVTFWRIHFLKLMKLFLLPMIVAQFLVTLMLELTPLAETPEEFGISSLLETIAVWAVLAAVIITLAIITTWFAIDFFRTNDT